MNVKLVSAARPADDENVNMALLVAGPDIHSSLEAALESDDFVECDTCRAKPGSPALCIGCLHNRAVISRLRYGR